MNQSPKPLILLTLLSALALWLSAPARAQQPETTLSLDATQIRLSRLAPGQPTDQVAFPIDQANVVTVEIIADLDGLATSLVSPAGQIIDPTTVVNLGGDFTTLTGAAADSPSAPPAATPGTHYVYTFPWLGAGNYIVRFQAAATLTREVAIITQVTTDSPIRAKLFATEPVVTLGRPSVLTAAVFNAQTPLTGANVAVFIKPPTGANLNLTLRDDGGTSDDVAGDGLYSGELTPAAPGRYKVLARITGTSGGITYSRETATEFSVVAAPSRLSGGAQDRGVDDDGDGLLDRVALDVPTQTTEAGTYRTFVSLKTANGQTIVRNGDAELQPGPGSITASFDADDLLALGENGPYTISLIDLVLVSAAGVSPCDRLENVGTTGTYLLNQFRRDPLILTGVTSDQGIDDNGNNRFDRLAVTVQVDVLRAGYYDWNMKLSDQNAREIGFAAGEGFLDAGLNNVPFEFNGSDIGTSGANGPFRLNDLLLFGPASIVVTEVGQTQPYRSLQFENGRGNDITPPTISVSLTPAVLRTPNHKLVAVTADVRVSDDTDPRPRIVLVSITSNEPDNGLGDGDTPDDIQGAIFGTDDRDFLLRAERSGKGVGRRYTITYRATDAAGNSTETTATVEVPHDQGK